MRKPFLLFDLDGTLWDAGPEVAQSFNEVLEKIEPKYAGLTTERIHSLMGKTMDAIADELFCEEKLERRMELLSQCSAYEVEYIKKSGGTLYPGVLRCLSVLRERGYKMAIVSNCQTGYVPAFLSSMKMREFFTDYEQWGNTGKTKGENIRLVMERNNEYIAYYIGDTQGDCEAAAYAGIPFVHAAYGFGQVNRCEYSLQAFGDLLSIFQ